MSDTNDTNDTSSAQQQQSLTITAPVPTLTAALRAMRHECARLDAECSPGSGIAGRALSLRQHELQLARMHYAALMQAITQATGA